MNFNFFQKKIHKIHAWEQGIITGTGEESVVKRSINLFHQTRHLNINNLPQCLNISRQIRELEIGMDYYQVENTKLLCSCYSENGAQLYTIQRFEPSQPYELTTIPPMDITVWLFHPSIDAISENLQNLHNNLKDYATFTNKADWINHYINYLAPIYQKQSQHDPLMSKSFDLFFQTKDKYVTGHIPNTQNIKLEFKEISCHLKSLM